MTTTARAVQDETVLSRRAYDLVNRAIVRQDAAVWKAMGI